MTFWLFKNLIILRTYIILMENNSSFGFSYFSHCFRQTNNCVPISNDRCLIWQRNGYYTSFWNKWYDYLFGCIAKTGDFCRFLTYDWRLFSDLYVEIHDLSLLTMLYTFLEFAETFYLLKRFRIPCHRFTLASTIFQ